MGKAHRGPRGGRAGVRRQERPLEAFNGQFSISGNAYTTLGCVCSSSTRNASWKKLITPRALQFIGRVQRYQWRPRPETGMEP